jgi:hypothetical protein
MAKTRLNIELSEDVARILDELASEAETTKTDVLRRGLAIMKVAADQRKYGRRHLGFVSDPTKLDAELVGF